MRTVESLVQQGDGGVMSQVGWVEVHTARSRQHQEHCSYWDSTP